MERIPKFVMSALREFSFVPRETSRVRIFLSCRHSDANERVRFQEALERRYGKRFQCEWDEFGQEENWRGRCESAIRASEGLVCLIGESASGSHGIPWEVRTARALAKPVLAVKLSTTAEIPVSVTEAGVSGAAESMEDAALQFETLLLGSALLPAKVSTGLRVGDPAATSALLEQYRLLFESTESIQTRRQSLHTFFMSINSLFIAAIGLIGQQALDGKPGLGLIIAGIGLFGLLLCGSWRRQIRAYGKVSSSKFDVLRQLEAHLPASPFVAEWAALVQNDYESFTEAEARIPVTFQCIHTLAVVAGVGVTLAAVI